MKFGVCARPLAFLAAIFLAASVPFPLSGAQAKEKAEVSAWITYWDLPGGQEELGRLRKKAAKVSYFGAYFDASDRLFVPAELMEARRRHREKGERYEAYLTIVNDKLNKGAPASIKDTDVLRRVLADVKARERHADEILALAESGGYAGVEIDYERVFRDPAVTGAFVQFIEVMSGKAAVRGLKLRVVLEPGAPFLLLSSIEGAEYVVMLYNLYGLHSGPGPKADPAFIRRTLKAMAVLPGGKNAAFSTGGCLWGDNGEKRFLTEKEAAALAKEHNANLSRDENSRCLVFSYKAGGVKYTVWYADKDTLRHWVKTAKQDGCRKISLWRLGGNSKIEEVD